MRHRQFWTAWTSALVLALAGCGGSTQSDGSGSGSAGAGASQGVDGGGAGGRGGAGGSGGGGGLGGGTAGAGGLRDAGAGCPDDIFAAIGTPCAVDGTFCGGENCDPDPCSFCNLIHCFAGQWERLEAHPDPNCFDSGPRTCGGFAEQPCTDDEYCDFEYAGTNYCGGDDSPGICRKRPGGCEADCPGVCGCDGNFYCNACMANAAGVDDTDDTTCMNGGGPGDSCTGANQCRPGLLCCYPCGIPGCSNECMAPDPSGGCPLFP